MDVNQIFELGKQYWPFAMTIIVVIGNVISWYLSVQKSRDDKKKAPFEIQKMLLEIRKSEIEVESLRKGEIGDQPSDTPSERELPKLLKADWTKTANIGLALLALILFCVVWVTPPLTVNGLVFMIFLLFVRFLTC